MRNFSLPYLAILCIGIFWTSCGCSDPPPWPEKADASPGQATPATDHLVVYLDTSASMAGYVSPNRATSFAVSPDGETIFTKVLHEIRQTATSMNPRPRPVIRRVDSVVSEPSFDDIYISRTALARGAFNGRETNLAEAIRSFSKPLLVNSDEENPPRFHVLVTDGVQSSDEDNSGLSCAKGSDAYCVKKQLVELMDKGWGGTILGLRSEFNGNVHSELARRPVPYASGNHSDKFRPFYLYIFSPDRGSLDELVSTLREPLESIVGKDSLREYPLTTTFASGQPSIATKSDLSGRGMVEVYDLTEGDDGLPRLDVRVDMDTESLEDKERLEVRVKTVWSASALKGGTATEMNGLIKWDLRPVYPAQPDPSKRYPDLKLKSQDVDDDEAVLTFETGWVRSIGDCDWKVFELVGVLDTKKKGPPWLSAWTTNRDDRPDTANLTLGFESSVANLWDNSAVREQSVARILIRVGEN